MEPEGQDNEQIIIFLLRLWEAFLVLLIEGSGKLHDSRFTFLFYSSFLIGVREIAVIV